MARKKVLAYLLVFVAVVSAVVFGTLRGNVHSSIDSSEIGSTVIPTFDNNATNPTTWSSGTNIGTINSYLGVVNGDTTTGPNKAVTLDKSWTMSLWVYSRSQEASFVIKDASGKKLIDGNGTSLINDGEINLHADQKSWRHVTIIFSHDTKELIVKDGDRNVDTGLPSVALNQNVYKVTGSGTDNTYAFTGDGAVGLNSFSSYAATSASAVLFDDDQNKVIADGATVNSGDHVTMTYTFKYEGHDTLQAKLSKVRFKASLLDVDQVTWDSQASIEPNTANRVINTSDLNAGIEIGDLNEGDTVTIKVGGTAQSASTGVPSTSYLFYNGGAESYLDAPFLNGGSEPLNPTTPGFTITPDLATTSNVRVTDLDSQSQSGVRELTDGDIILPGDRLKYVFTMDIAADSKVSNWDNVTAKVAVPTGMTVDKITYKKADGTTKTVDAGADFRLGSLTKGKNTPITVEMTGTANKPEEKNGKFNNYDVDISAATATFSSAEHEEVAKAPTLIARQPQHDDSDLGAEYLRIDSPAKTTKDSPFQLGTATATEGSAPNQDPDDGSFIIRGGIDGGQKLTDNQVTYVVILNGVKLPSLRLNGVVNNNPFSFKFVLPDSAWSGNLKWSESNGGPQVTMGQLQDGINEIVIEAITDDGVMLRTNYSGSYTDYASVYAETGSLKLAANDINFNTIDLTGKQQKVFPSNPAVTITNTAWKNWSLSLQQTSVIKNADGTELAGALMYQLPGSNSATNLSQGFDASNLTAPAGAVQVASGNKDDNADDGTVNITKNWATSAQDLATRGGLYLDVNGNAVEGSYTGSVTWTLADTPTN